MRDLLLTLLRLAVTTAKLCGPSGVRAVIANLVLKQQLIVLRRGRRRAPSLTMSDRLRCGFGSLFISRGRIEKVLSAGETLSPCFGPNGPLGLAFIGHTTDSLWSVDLFRCESIVLRSYWVLVVMGQFTRRLVGFGVQCGVATGADVCRMFNAASYGLAVPRHLRADHDPLFEAHRWTANLRILELDETKTVPHAPLSHPFVERLIGTVRREFLDQVLFWNARDLERKLVEFQTYYNAVRGHASLAGHTPLAFASGHTARPADMNQCAGSPIAEASSSFRSPPDTNSRPTGFSRG